MILELLSSLICLLLLTSLNSQELLVAPVQHVELHSAAEAGWRLFLHLARVEAPPQVLRQSPGCQVDNGWMGARLEARRHLRISGEASQRERDFLELIVGFIG